jgi:hypothetical protein
MIYRGPGFLAVMIGLLAHRPPPGSIARPATHRKADKERQVLTGEEEEGEGVEPKLTSHDRKEAWPSVNHSILSDIFSCDIFYTPLQFACRSLFKKRLVWWCVAFIYIIPILPLRVLFEIIHQKYPFHFSFLIYHKSPLSCEG